MDVQSRMTTSLPGSEISEWKSSWHDEYMKWMSAFAYTHGGTLHIGGNDDGYVAKMVIDKDRIALTNANRPHGEGNLDISTFVPYQKNPPISKVFREMEFADELGSGMRKTYRYTMLYSGAESVFTEDGDVFRITIPFCEAATVLWRNPEKCGIQRR